MKFTPDDLPEQNFIRSYDAGRLTINEVVYERSLIVTADRIIPDWEPADFDQLTAVHLRDLCGLEVEIILLGTGATLRFPPPEFTGPVAGQGIGIEVMDTAAACRTYNVLLSENRRVAAALLLG